MLIKTISMAALAEGEKTVLSVGGVQILLCHVHGQFYATEAICSHAGQSLAAGRLRGTEVSCPLHGARFDVRSGACLAAPADKPIRTFPVMLEAGKVWVDVN